MVWIPVVGFLQITAGTALLTWSNGAFVRQDLAAAVMPVALLIVFAVIAGAAWGAHLLLRGRIERLPRWAILASAIGGAVLAAIIHLVRFPAVLDDPLIPALLQVAVVLGVGLGMPVVRPRAMRIAALALGAAWVGLLVLLVFVGRIAPLSYPVAAAAIDQRGMMAARVAPLLVRLGDGDGDGFGRWFGGLDCDDGDAAVNPLAGDTPGDGVDSDCFEGDLGAAALAADRASRAPRTPPRARADNVLLITVDALRADALGPRAHGTKKRSATPNVDRLAARSAVFEDAWTQAPMTRRAFPALLAGRYPANIHWLDLQTKYPYPVSHEDNVYLAEVVRDAGIHTAFSIPFNYAENSRFDQGFQDRAVHPASKFKDDVCAPAVVDDAIKQLRPGAPRFFLWVHFYEAHHPYVVHQGLDFGGEPHERYLSEVAFIDREVGRLLDALRAAGLADRTAVIFTGDHGEEFGEHGGEAHGDLYPEDLRVPLVVHVPGAAPRRVTTPARVIDVAPTVLDALGLPAPESFDGASLLPEVDGAAPPARTIYAELIPDRNVPRRMVTLVEGGWQLIVDFARGSRSLYDLAHDPTAQHNLLVEAPARARELELALRRHLALRVGPLRVSRAKEKK